MNAAPETDVRPEWVRVPTALKVVEVGRRTLEGWMKSQAVKSRSVKAKGNIRGLRLVNLPSLLAHVENSEGAK